MKQTELVSALETFGHGKVAHRRTPFEGQETFALFLARYVAGLKIPADQKYIFWKIDNHVPTIIVGAIRVFEKSQKPWVVKYRTIFEKEARHPFRDLTRLNISGEEALDVTMIKRLIGDTMGVGIAEPLVNELDALLNAERSIVGLRFAQFQHDVYDIGGLSQIIAASSSRGMTGNFGMTTLRSYIAATSLMFTFSRKIGDTEQSVSFVCDENDLIGLGASMQSCYAELSIALAMIEDVITNWEANKATFQDKKSVTLG